MVRMNKPNQNTHMYQGNRHGRPATVHVELRNPRPLFGVGISLLSCRQDYRGVGCYHGYQALQLTYLLPPPPPSIPIFFSLLLRMIQSPRGAI